MKYFILLIIVLVFISGCRFETMSETLPCENCSSRLLSFKECKPICEARFKEVNGSIIFGQKINTFKGYKKSIQYKLGQEGKTISCVCSYGP